MYATDLSSNGTYLKKNNTECSSSQSERGVLMGRKNGSFLLDDGDELRLSESVTLTYHEMESAKEHQLTPTQLHEKALFASRYLITGRLLGLGGYGKVLVGIHQKTQRQLACKVVNLRLLYKKLPPPNLRLPTNDRGHANITAEARHRWPSQVTRCFREFDILKELNHPNIVSIEKVFWSSNTIYLFEELVTGGDLFSYIEYKGNRLEDVEAAVIVRQILKGVEYLHDHDIVHRDLKPDNILLTSLEDGARIVITDFGNARFLPKDRNTAVLRDVPKKRMFSVVGTLEYVAPEIHKLNRAIPSGQGYSKAVDMWSIGSITATLLAGDVIFTNREDPQYDKDPAGVILGLSSKCDISIIDDKGDTVWGTVGNRPKDFIKKLLVLEEEDRMTATEALSHPWFSNECHAAEFEALYERSIADWQPRRRIFRLIEPIRERSTDTISGLSERSSIHEPVSHHFPLRAGNRMDDVRDSQPASQSSSANPSPLPIAEEHEEALYEGPSRYDQQSYDDDTNNTGYEDLPSPLGCPDSIGNSVDQLLHDSDPPASGMYSTHENVQDSYGYGESMGEAMDEAYPLDENPAHGSRPPVPDTEPESVVIYETPTGGEYSINDSPPPMPPESPIASQGPHSAYDSRPPIPETMPESFRVQESPIEGDGNRASRLDYVLPSYRRIFGEAVSQARTSYSERTHTKRRKLTHERD